MVNDYLNWDYVHDPGHGWLKIPLSDLKGFAPSSYSFYDDTHAYLEEDCDMPNFLHKNRRNGCEFKEVYVDHFNRYLSRFAGEDNE